VKEWGGSGYLYELSKSIMEVKTYKYNIAPMILGICVMAFFVSIFYMLANDGNDKKPLNFFYFVVFLVLIRIVYMSICYYVPYLKGKTALVIDKEKLQYFVKPRIPLYQ